ncbi:MULTISPECIES: O-antigen ligase family protein [unclassified Bradyrhizobium]|uniref:O-antigen ligase family protein n=1 Tax=unclassified Bradyrhizobium TaxID=2631580 RepID=UPI0028E7044A|nr:MULTISPECIES: O-antigen ligase family protein [unclassified Bradyrhizobium]
MAVTAAAEEFASRPMAPPGVVALQRTLVWLVGVSGAIVFIEPSPYELVTLASAAVFFATGMRLRLVFLPLLLLLVLVNLGYTISAIPLLDDSKIATWIATSWYMAFTAIFIAMLTSDDTESRLDMLRRGLVMGGAIAALAGVAGYFHLVPGGYDLLTLYGRARGTFKDPNVLGAFLILPALLALQNVVTARFAATLRASFALGVMALAILLAFSRAAWGGLVLTAAFMLAMMVLTSQTRGERSRIIFMTLAAAVAGIVLIGVLLSIDSIADMFKQRASFDQSYDEGRFGRFGRHILGADMALDLPFGIGPLQFHNYFPEDTHNSYLNAFMSGGWLSGICYPALVFTTVILGFRYLFVRVPWQRTYIAVFSAFLGTVGESFIIDTDHWRHFFLMLGTMWGMIAATRAHQAEANRSAGIGPHIAAY